MSGLFRRKKVSELAMRANATIERYARLKTYCPGAGYVFAGTLRRTRELVGDRTLSSGQKLLLVDRNIKQATPDRGADGGISLAALRFVRLVLASDCDADGMGAMMLNGVYVTIADQGKSYRDLQESDRLPPLHEKVRVPLQKSGFSTIADLVTAIRNPPDGIGDPPTVMQESVWNILAMMNLRGADQHVWTLVSELESAISGTFVRA